MGLIILNALLPTFVRAQGNAVQTLTTQNSQSPSVNVNDTGFKFVACDGPKPPPGATNIPSNYVVCDFNGLMLTVQHFIDIFMVAGVLWAILGSCYAGYLYIKGTEGDIKKAKQILHNLIFGFLIMLTAWFVVFQILTWLTGGSSGFTTLLGGK